MEFNGSPMANQNLTEEEVGQIIEAVDDNKDAEQGLTWDNIDYWTDEISDILIKEIGK